MSVFGSQSCKHLDTCTVWCVIQWRNLSALVVRTIIKLKQFPGTATGERQCVTIKCPILMDHNLISLSPCLAGISSSRQVQAPPPSSPRRLLATLWRQAQCIPHPPGRCRGIPCPAQPSSSRNPPSTAHGGKLEYAGRNQSPVAHSLIVCQQWLGEVVSQSGLYLKTSA